mmetsp:Transcript_2101/g.7504  ORF Transcript_2101/g.7504 Transcript_2101/m.7504 type:complete len:397 (-) Transcript_2101:35-1225(-)
MRVRGETSARFWLARARLIVQTQRRNGRRDCRGIHLILGVHFRDYFSPRPTILVKECAIEAFRGRSFPHPSECFGCAPVVQRVRAFFFEAVINERRVHQLANSIVRTCRGNARILHLIFHVINVLGTSRVHVKIRIVTRKLAVRLSVRDLLLPIHLSVERRIRRSVHVGRQKFSFAFRHDVVFIRFPNHWRTFHAGAVLAVNGVKRVSSERLRLRCVAIPRPFSRRLRVENNKRRVVEQFHVVRHGVQRFQMLRHRRFGDAAIVDRLKSQAVANGRRRIRKRNPACWRSIQNQFFIQIPLLQQMHVFVNGYLRRFFDFCNRRVDVYVQSIRSGPFGIRRPSRCFQPLELLIYVPVRRLPVLVRARRRNEGVREGGEKREREEECPVERCGHLRYKY